ncbi:MAG: hypothetical protein ABI690_14450 [Chloroflexota bacterium]
MEKKFSRIEQINWNQFDVPNLPVLLRDLTSNNPEKWQRAYETLDSLYVTANSESWENYGSVSQILKTDAPIYIIPFLLEFLGSDTINNKWGLLQLLADWANIGRIYQNTAQEPYRERARKLYEAAQVGINHYKSFLSSDDNAIAGLANDLVKTFADVQ